MDGVSSVWVRRPVRPLGAGQWVKLVSFSLLHRKVQKQGPRFLSWGRGRLASTLLSVWELQQTSWRRAVSEDCHVASHSFTFITPLALRAPSPRGTRLAVMGPGDLSPSLWIPVSPPAAKVKTTQCWSLHPQRLSRKGKKCSHKQSCRQEKYRFEGLLARPICDTVIKWELWFCFLYILQQVKWGRGSHLRSLFPGQEPCPGPLCSGWEWELRVQELNCGFRRQTHSSRSISSVCSDCCYSLLGPFCFELILYKGPYICYFLSNWENPLPQFSAAPQQNFLLLLFCSCSFPFMYW